ncbi:MAG: VirB8/TrbF family protein [Alphaproteobacteria bacterium]|nr:VirB8/TrbF family protein [Alphaproteobacteria bacterium]
MQNRVKPPVLISRLLTFVLAMSLVVLGALVFTLDKMFPLNRPQIFFLTTTTRADQDIKLVQMPPKSEHLDIYKKSLVREYVKHRNEIRSNAKVMTKKWNSVDGFVRNMSTDGVYTDFINTSAFNTIMNDTPSYNLQCDVFFDGEPLPISKDTYQVTFRYFCKDSTRPATQKDYTIRIKIETQDNTKIKWANKIENPLGMRVSEYEIISENGDPLDTGFMQN